MIWDRGECCNDSVCLILLSGWPRAPTRAMAIYTMFLFHLYEYVYCLCLALDLFLSSLISTLIRCYLSLLSHSCLSYSLIVVVHVA